MTHPKDPQADIREAIKQHRTLTVKNEGRPELGLPSSEQHEVTFDEQELLALFQAREQQLLTELLEASSPFGKNKVWAVPVAVIQRYREGN